MILHIVNVLLFECTFSVSLPDIKLILLLFGHIIIVGHGVWCYLFVPCFTSLDCCLMMSYVVDAVAVLFLCWNGKDDSILYFPASKSKLSRIFEWRRLVVYGDWNFQNKILIYVHEEPLWCSRLYLLNLWLLVYSFTFMKQLVGPTRSSSFVSYFFSSLFLCFINSADVMMRVRCLFNLISRIWLYLLAFSCCRAVACWLFVLTLTNIWADFRKRKRFCVARFVSNSNRRKHSHARTRSRNPTAHTYRAIQFPFNSLK